MNGAPLVLGTETETRTLLLVDDEPRVCAAMKRVLYRQGYRIHAAHSAEEALAILAEHPVDVIISDQRMPGAKGTEFLGEVQRRYPGTVRIVLSGAADVKEVAAAMESGVIYKFLTKPIDPLLLRANVREAFSHIAAHPAGEQRIEADLRRAVAAKRFHVCYQPQVHIASGHIVGLEALVRWRREEQGLVSPAAFIPLAERLGLIDEIGAWVAETAIRQMAAWARVGHAPEELAINASALQLRSPSFAETLRGALVQHRVPASRIVLEVTETAAIEQGASIAECLVSLQKLGVRLAVDDFGTGYSNLSNITRFPFQKLKLDRSLLPKPGNERSARLFANVVAMANELDLDVICEGVETEAELAAARAAGCPVVQGYIFSPAQSADRIGELLNRAGESVPRSPQGSAVTAGACRNGARRRSSVDRLVADETDAGATDEGE